MRGEDVGSGTHRRSSGGKVIRGHGGQGGKRVNALQRSSRRRKATRMWEETATSDTRESNNCSRPLTHGPAISQAGPQVISNLIRPSSDSFFFFEDYYIFAYFNS